MGSSAARLLNMALDVVLENVTQLGEFLQAEAARIRARVAFDTHYDAGNWEVSWWCGRTLHRLDFQSLEGSKLSIAHYQDHFRAFPRLLRWAHNVVPMFPYLASIEQRRCADSCFPLRENDVRSALAWPDV